MFKNMGNKIIEEVIKFIFMLVIYFVSSIFTTKELINSLKNSLAIIIPYLIYIFIMVLISIIQKPILISIKMNNYLFKEKEETDLCHFHTYREEANTVTLDLYIGENNSCWGKVAKKFFKGKKFIIKVELDPPVHEFLCQPCEFPEQVSYKGTYFKIDISEIVFSKLENNIPTNQQYKFIIKENKDKPPLIDGTYHIKPSFLINEKKINFFEKQFIKYSLNMKKDYYVVNFRR